jgi:hypothetical protein
MQAEDKISDISEDIQIDKWLRDNWNDLLMERVSETPPGGRPLPNQHGESLS